MYVGCVGEWFPFRTLPKGDVDRCYIEIERMRLEREEEIIAELYIPSVPPREYLYALYTELVRQWWLAKDSQRQNSPDSFLARA